MCAALLNLLPVGNNATLALSGGNTPVRMLLLSRFFAVIVPSLLPYFATLEGECNQLSCDTMQIQRGQNSFICAKIGGGKNELHVVVSLWTLLYEVT